MARKTPESEWEEAERLGPYRIHEQLPQSGTEGGAVFRATHVETGATALVLKPLEVPGLRSSLSAWQVHVISSPSPAYLAMEVEHSAWAFTDQKQSAEELIFTFEGLQGGVRHMARHVPTSTEESPRWWRPAGLLASAVAVGLLVFALVPHLLGPRRPEAPESTLARPGNETDAEWPIPKSLTDTTDETPGGLFRPVPSKPLDGQKRPPCNKPMETEINGGCWVQAIFMAPCPGGLAENEGKCYSAAFSAKDHAPRSVEK